MEEKPDLLIMILSRTPFRISFVGGGSDLPSWYKKQGSVVYSRAIFSYVEKPTDPKTNIFNAGVCVFNTSFLRNLEVRGGFLDIRHDLLPQLIGRSYGYLLDEFLMDIGSHFSLDKARKTLLSLFTQVSS